MPLVSGWSVRTDTGVWVEVADNVPLASPTRLVGLDDEHGRGLLLVAAVSDQWGIRGRGSRGKWTRAFFAVTETEGPR